MKKVLIATLLTLTLAFSGCTVMKSDTGTFAVQYATLKLIEESDKISAENVVDTTDKVREIVDENEELTMSTLTSSFRERVDISSLSPADQMLVNAIISRIQSTVSERVNNDTGFFTVRQTTTVLQLLDDVDEAAILSLD